MHIDGGRTLQAFGPCDQYGDPLPDGVARIRVVYKSSAARHGIVLSYVEAQMLLEELTHACSAIEANRAMKLKVEKVK